MLQHVAEKFKFNIQEFKMQVSDQLVQRAGTDVGSLALQGNTEDYYSPSNSLLCDVMCQLSGIPISLAILHMAVGQQAGLPIHLMNMPMHIINWMPLAAQTNRGAGAPLGAASNDGDVRMDDEVSGGGAEGQGGSEATGGPDGQADSQEEELFIDVFGGARVMSWQELRWVGAAFTATDEQLW